MMMRGFRQSTLATVLVVAIAGSSSAQPIAAGNQTTVPIFTDARIEWDRAIEDGRTAGDGHRVYRFGQMIEASVDLPPLPQHQRDTRQIIATLRLEPVVVEDADQAQDGQKKVRPGDPWTRLGAVSIVLPESQSKPARPSATQPAMAPAVSPGEEVEMLRFISSFGGPGIFTQDVTALAPLLAGTTRFRVFISTFKSPAWKVSLSLTYIEDAAGYRRPVFAKPLFNQEQVTADANRLVAIVDIPPRLATPRLWITSTGHATDGTAGDEFVSRTHILRIDGREVARWRPWAEDGASLRQENPMSGHMTIDGRELWSSDLDRSGWMPGRLVEPLRIPVPELTAGRHQVEVEVVGIRPKEGKNYGYWRICAIAVADEPWPDRKPETD